MKSKETIIVFSAHSDDFVIGAGGTLANYAAVGKKVIVVVFSYGESSHPWLKKRIIQKLRAEEAQKAGQILNCKVIIFDLKEFNFKTDYQAKNLQQTLLTLIEKERPIKLFTHSPEDPHPDHNTVNSITIDLYSKLTYQPEIYTYSIWNPVSFRTKFPSLCIDISKQFPLKLKALKAFKSQKWHIIYPVVISIIRAIIDGFKIHKWFGERFYRIR